MRKPFLKRLKPDPEQLASVESLGFPTPVRMNYHRDILGRLVVVPGLEAKRYAIALVEPDHGSR